MAVASYDPVTGRPIYDNDITNPAEQFQEAADYAESVGAQSVGSYSALSSVPFKRPGMLRTVTADGQQYRYVSSSVGWLPTGPFFDLAKRRVIGATNNFTDRVSPTDLPNATDRTDAAATFTKVSGGTNLIAFMQFSAQLDAGPLQNILGYLNIDGSVYEIARFKFPSLSRWPVIGTTTITGVPAGDLAVKPQFASATAANLNMFANDDALSWSLRETL